MAHTVYRCVVALVLAGGAAAGYEPRLDLQAIDAAITIGQSRLDAVRIQFHQPYRIHVGRPPVDYIDVVTPFRRVELAAEERARAGNPPFRQHEALAVLAEHGEQLKLFVELTFHPLNTYVGVPPYVVALARADSPARIDAVDTQPIPRFGPRLSGTPLPYPTTPVIPSGSEPMLGGTLVVSFETRPPLDPRGVYDVVLEEARVELVRVRLNLGAMR